MSTLDTYFANPWLFALLTLLPGLALTTAVITRRRQRAALVLTGVRAAADARPAGQRLRLAGRLVTLSLIIVGLAGPRWGRDPIAPAPLGRDLLVVLDVSQSMLAEDLPPASRLERAKRELSSLVDQLARRGGHRLGLIAFAGQARVLCPLTDDYDHFRFAIDLAHPDRFGPAERVEYRADGTGVGTNLRAALDLALTAHDPGAVGFQEILLVTDGDDLAGDLQAAVERTRNCGIPVHALGVGDPTREAFIPTGRADEPFLLHEPAPGQPRVRARSRRHDDVLESLATETRGVYVKEESRPEPLVDWFRERIAGLPVRERADDGRPVLVERYAWFYGAALALLALQLAFGSRRNAAHE